MGIQPMEQHHSLEITHNPLVSELNDLTPDHMGYSNGIRATCCINLSNQFVFLFMSYSHTIVIQLYQSKTGNLFMMCGCL